MPDPKEVAALRANACPPIDDLAAFMGWGRSKSKSLKERNNGKT
jgi:hypothetical protein